MIKKIADEQQNRKSNITLAIDKDILEQIKHSAESENLSANALVNNILQKYLLFYKYAEEKSSITIPSAIYSYILENIDEKKNLEMMKRTCSEIIPSIFAHNNLDYTVDNLLVYCFEGIGKWAGLYSSFKYYYDSSEDLCCVFEHNYNIKWSKVIGPGFSYLVENNFKLPTKYELMPNTVVLKILTK